MTCEPMYSEPMSKRDAYDILCGLQTWNQKGEHFTSVVPYGQLLECENRGWIEINRNTYEGPLADCNARSWTVDVTPEGLDVIDLIETKYPAK